jgi:hypothetical protein
MPAEEPEPVPAPGSPPPEDDEGDADGEVAPPPGDLIQAVAEFVDDIVEASADEGEHDDAGPAARGSA